VPDARRRRIRAIVNLLPALAFAATFGFFFVDKSRSARSVLGSGRGMVTVAAIAGGYAVIGVLLRRNLRRTWLPPVVLATIVLGLAAWIVRPYYVDKTANRELVTGPVLDAPTTTNTNTSDTTGTTGTTGGATRTTPAAPTTLPPAGPVRVASGEIVGIDHDASGTASIVRAADGLVVVRLEEFDIEGVPDPVVYLVDASGAREPADGADIGGLPGNQGDLLDIEVPGGLDPGPGWTVLVWCRAFAVPVAHATLQSQ
jgi:hypothetical protein